MYSLKFEDDETGRKRYEIATQSLLLAGKTQGSNRTVQVSEWDEVIDLLKALKGGGVKSKQNILGTFLYDLQDGGATVLLEKAEHKLLIDFIKQPIWQPEGIEAAKECVQWLSGLEYQRGSKKVDARPEDKRAAEEESKVAGHISAMEPG
jgi:hypothetical protein